MNQTKANIDLCGIYNLLELLKTQGFAEKELRKISARIAAQIGANIIMADIRSTA